MFALPFSAGLKSRDPPPLDKQFNHWCYFTFSVASVMHVRCFTITVNCY